MFVVPELDGPADPRIDLLNLRLDAVVESHNGLNLVTVLTPGITALDAARAAITVLHECGWYVERSYPDLVTRADVTERTGMERQTIDHWIRGQRRKDFPRPVHLAGKGLWLWHDVAEWLNAQKVQLEEGAEEVSYPCLADHAVIDSELRSRLIWSVVAVNSRTASLDTSMIAATSPRRGPLVGAA